MKNLHGAEHFQQSCVEPVSFVDTLGAQAEFLSFPPSHIQPETARVTMLVSTTIQVQLLSLGGKFQNSVYHLIILEKILTVKL